MMAFVYLSTLLLSFVLSLAPALQFLLDPVFSMLGVGGGFKTPLIDILIILGMLLIFANNPGGRVKIEFIGIFKWWVPWIFYLLIRSNLSGLGFWKFEMYIARLLIPTMAIVLVYIAIPNKFEKYFFGLLLSLAFILVPTTYLYDFSGKDFFNNIWLSRMLAICSLYLFISISLRFNVVLKIVALLFFFIAMVLIGSRGPVLSLVLTATIYFIIKNKGNVFVMLGGCVLAIVISVFVAQLTNISVSSEVASFLTHGKSEDFAKLEEADDRTGVYSGTIDIIVKAPVFGVGLGGWSKVYYKNSKFFDDGEYKYPHNFLMEVLSELGIIGLLLFLMLLKPFRRFFSLKNKYNIFVLLGFLFASTSSDMTQNSAPLIFGILSQLNLRYGSSSNAREQL